MPNLATVKDCGEAYMQSWRLGLKQMHCTAMAPSLASHYRGLIDDVNEEEEIMIHQWQQPRRGD